MPERYLPRRFHGPASTALTLGVALFAACWVIYAIGRGAPAWFWGFGTVLALFALLRMTHHARARVMRLEGERA